MGIMWLKKVEVKQKRERVFIVDGKKVSIIDLGKICEIQVEEKLIIRVYKYTTWYLDYKNNIIPKLNGKSIPLALKYIGAI